MDLQLFLYGAIAALGFGFVIFIHELGHFLIAKWAKVRVLRFSIGFGPVLLKWRRGETDYALSLLPLGGYVQMAGEEPVDGKAGAAPPEPGSFQSASYAWRAFILLGGVLFNLLSSWIILFGLAFWGMPLLAPVIGDVVPTMRDNSGDIVPSPAARLGLHANDRVLTFNGETVRSFEDIALLSTFSGNAPIHMTVERGGNELTLPAATTAAGLIRAQFDPEQGRPALGVQPPFGNTIVAAIRPDGKTATREDLIRPGDKIISVNGVRLPVDGNGHVTTTGQSLMRMFYQSQGKPVALIVSRDNQEIAVEAVIAGSNFTGISYDRQIGLPVRVGLPLPESPAQRAGVQPGDVILTINDQPCLGAESLMGAIETAGAAGRAMKLTLWRESSGLVAVQVTPENRAGRWIIGLPFEVMTNGRIAPEGFALSGALAATGIRPGDLLLGTEVNVDGFQVTLRSATGGIIRMVPLPADKALVNWMSRSVQPQLVARLFGVKSAPVPLSILTTGAVVDDLAADGQGVPVGGVRIRVDAAAASAATQIVRFADAGIAGVAFAKRLNLQPGERVLGVWPSATGSALAIVRDYGSVRSATVAMTGRGWTLAMIPEERPYRLHSPAESVAIVGDASMQMIVKSLTLIPKFFASPEDGGIDPNKTLTGPVGMFRTLKFKAETTGFDGFLRMVALIGLNLVLVNLLPIPVTDGGQLVFLGLEAARGKPVSARIRMVAAVIGTALVLMMMAYVVGLDVLRWIGVI